MMPFLSLFGLAFGGQLAFFGLRYLVICGGAAALPKLFPGFFAPRRISPDPLPRGQVRREVTYSLLSMLVFALVGGLVIPHLLAGGGLLYLDLASRSLGYFAFSLLALVCLHDSYFYWIHRLLHHPLLFRPVHLVHHLSQVPTPWAAFAFHPLEALLMAVFVPGMVWLLPLHPLAIALFLTYMTLINAWGHWGYALLPTWFPHRWPWAASNTAVHHAQHHAEFNCNYGLYWNLWDRAMGTNHPDYLALYDQIQARIRQ